MICGLGLVDPGPYLHQLILPCDNTAAHDHLTNPDLCDINDDYAKSCIMNGNAGTTRSKLIDESDFDCTMSAISSELGYCIYRRSCIEIMLCESRSDRVLDKTDVFKRGQCIFNVSDLGIPIMKSYGYHGPWPPINPLNKKFKLISNI